MSALSSRQRRLRRGVKSRKRQALLGVARVVAHLTGKHTYAQLVASDYRVLASASTVDYVSMVFDGVGENWFGCGVLLLRSDGFAIGTI